MDFDSGDLAICVTCGTQYDAPLSSPPTNCRICDDPRQYIPPTGQAWTSLNEAQQTQKNTFTTDDHNPSIHFLHTDATSPSSKPLGIGQRAILLQTARGNILWDCLAFLSPATISSINALGGLTAIVISHPHFYTTHLEWARVFDCPVYLCAADKEWLNRADTEGRRVFFDDRAEIVQGVSVVRVGGHFDGSSVLCWDDGVGGSLLHADSIMVTPAAYYHKHRLPGTASYSFMWSYPNMIPLPPDQIHGIWQALKPLNFTATYGGFPGQNNRRPDIKEQVLESMKIFVRTGGHKDAAILQETL